jgi:hypothetical protein
MSVPIVTDSTGRKFGKPTIFSAILNASAEIVTGSRFKKCDSNYRYVRRFSFACLFDIATRQNSLLEGL